MSIIQRMADALRPSTTPQPTMTTDTVQLGNTLASLDGLLQGYTAVLDDAKRQLETLELTDAHIKKITDRLGDDTTIRNRITASVSSSLHDSLLADDVADLGRLIDTISQRVWEQLQSRLEDALNDRFNELLNSDTVERLVTERITSNYEVGLNRDIADAMSSVLAACVKRDESALERQQWEE